MNVLWNLFVVLNGARPSRFSSLLGLGVFGFIVLSLGMSSAYASRVYLGAPDPTPYSATHLPYGADDAIRVQDLKCVETENMTNEELRREIVRDSTDAHQSADFGPLHFASEDAGLLKVFEFLIRDPDGKMASEAKRPFAGTSSPNDLIEATQVLFGEREGLQLLFLGLRYGVNGSPFQSQDAVPFTASELDDIILTFSDLPEHLIPLPLSAYNRQFGFLPVVRYKHGYEIQVAKDTVVAANSHITIYDRWTSIERRIERRGALFHEIGHNLRYLISDDSSWEALSPWIYKGEEKPRKPSPFPEPFVSQYAKTSPGEDFAESVIAYRYAPAWLRERNPSKYAYLKEVVFNGLEYTAEEACARNSVENPVNARVPELIRRYVEYQRPLTDGKDMLQGTPKQIERRGRCDAQFIIASRDSLDGATTRHDECISEVAFGMFAGKVRMKELRFPKDSMELREADATDGIEIPKFEESLRARTGARARYSVSRAFLTDFRAFSVENTDSFPGCGHFSAVFLNWMTHAEDGDSAVVKARMYDISSRADINGVNDFLKEVCRRGILIRDAGGTAEKPGRLTDEEFWTGIVRVTGTKDVLPE